MVSGSGNETPTRRVCYFQAWRDVDSSRRMFGFEVWLTGGQIRLGKRLYRCRWVRDVYYREAS